MKYLCNSSKRFAKDVVEVNCDALQRFVHEGALDVHCPRVLTRILACAHHSRFATIYVFFSVSYSIFLALYTKDGNS